MTTPQRYLLRALPTPDSLDEIGIYQGFAAGVERTVT